MKKLEKRLDLIVEKKLEYVPTFGKKDDVENFRCYSNSKYANDTILSFDIYMGNKDKKVSIKFLLKNTNITTINEEFIKQWEEKIKTNGLDNVIDNVKVKTEGLKSYINLKNSYHKQQICRMMKNDVSLNIQY